jgi:hypothetical protein
LPAPSAALLTDDRSHSSLDNGRDDYIWALKDGVFEIQRGEVVG